MSSLSYWVKFLFPGDRTIAEPSDAQQPGLTLAVAAFLFTAYFIVAFVLGAVLSVVVVRSVGPDIPLLATAGSALAVSTASLAALVIVARHLVGTMLRDRAATAAAWALGRPRHSLVGLLSGVALFAVGFGAICLVAPPPESPLIAYLTELTTTPGLSALVWWASIIVVAPLAEELLFRGVLLGALSQHLNPSAAVAVVTTVFVAAHYTIVGAYPAAAFPIGLLGVGAAVLRLRTNAVGPAVFCHASYNAALSITACVLATP